uniref:Putative myosin-11 tabanus bromius n=1 Tax=Lutzomyia longipalpis TaxID=7200 RepID=A0A7G3AR34_LUTLO
MSQSAKEHEKIINTQREQLTRYETRLKDVVAAYKGLLKEKEALEVSLAALSKDSTKETKENGQDTKAGDSDNLQMQIATLMSSLATLSAEKSRMEASFQADKKQLRQEMQLKDNALREMQEKLKAAGAQSNIDVESVKSKLIVERHEREKEANDNMMMIRELQKLLSDERHLKENLEMQINDLKNQFATTNYSDKTIKELTSELDAARKKIKKLEKHENVSERENSALVLQQLQNEIAFLKQQHAAAIKSEQKRAIVAEERTKKLEALHEERVASLESRLAELSKTVGTYDRLRQQDQDNIHKLKERIAQFDYSDSAPAVLQEDSRTFKSINEIVDEIVRLKKVLMLENAKIPNPIDVSRIFAIASNDHGICMEEQMRLRREIENCQMENYELRNSVEVQKSHIHTLQEKVKVLNRNIDEQELELKTKISEHVSEMKAEKAKWKEMVGALEADYRSRIAELEQHLQKQRDRSLVLLEEKENEIKALRTSFNIFTPPTEDTAETSSQESSETRPHGTVLTTPGGSSVEEYHMLHYVHELARKDVEISALRKARHSAESALRQALQDKVTTQEELHDKINQLEEEVDRLERCKSREGANLEYLKNVTLSFLATNDNVSKRHMLNAIGAVLKFSPLEMKSITNYFSKKM